MVSVTCKPSWGTARAAYCEVVLRELVEHEVRPSSMFTVNADLFFGCRLFSGGDLIHVLQN